MGRPAPAPLGRRGEASDHLPRARARTAGGEPAGEPVSTTSNSAAARAAVSRAQRPVLSSARAAMPAPSPSTTHQTACSALVNAIPPRATADPTIVPEIATPSVVPVCRPAEASEAATPAIERGIPEPAVLVIGGLAAPRQ